jgi:hypothetical protein
MKKAENEKAENEKAENEKMKERKKKKRKKKKRKKEKGKRKKEKGKRKKEKEKRKKKPRMSAREDLIYCIAHAIINDIHDPIAVDTNLDWFANDTLLTSLIRESVDEEKLFTPQSLENTVESSFSNGNVSVLPPSVVQLISQSPQLCSAIANRISQSKEAVADLVDANERIPATWYIQGPGSDREYAHLIYAALDRTPDQKLVELAHILETDHKINTISSCLDAKSIIRNAKSNESKNQTVGYYDDCHYDDGKSVDPWPQKNYSQETYVEPKLSSNDWKLMTDPVQRLERLKFLRKEANEKRIKDLLRLLRSV